MVVVPLLPFSPSLLPYFQYYRYLPPAAIVVTLYHPIKVILIHAAAAQIHSSNRNPGSQKPVLFAAVADVEWRESRFNIYRCQNQTKS